MAAIAGTMFFMGVLAFAGWSIVATIRPRMGRIAFLLRYGSALGAELPPRPRATVRTLPDRPAIDPRRLRLAA